MRLAGQLVAALGQLSAALLFAIGAMLTYEVAARYLFNAPTIWAEELSRLAQIWAVFLGSAAMLRENEHIRVTVLTDAAPPWLRRALMVASLLFVAVVSALVARYGWQTAAKSLSVGRTSGSMLDIPTAWSQLAIPVGFGLLALQAVASAVGLLAGGPMPRSHEEGV